VALPALVQLALSWGLKTWVAPTDLVAVGLHALPGAALYGMLFWWFCVEPHEKQSLTRRLARWRQPRSEALVNAEENCP
jgi:hypothetical protein